MAVTPLKVLLFLAGATGAASGTAYVAGAFDPYLAPAPKAAAVDPAVAPGAAPADPAKPPVTAEPAEQPAAPQAQADPAKPDDPAKPADAAAAPAAASDPAKPAEQKVAAADPAPEKPAPEASAPGPIAPAFDLLRVEPDGSMVIAGHAAPGSSVEIVAGGKVLAKVDASPAGDFVAVLDEPLKPGDYQIVLRSTGPGELVVTSIETAVVSVPATADGQVLALVEQPGAPSKLISAPPALAETQKPADDVAAATPDPSEPASSAPVTTAPAMTEPAAPEAKPADQVAAAPADQPAAPPVELGADINVAVEAVEIEGRKVFIAGAAPAGRTVRIYANDLLLGDAKASPENRFLLEAERDLKVGDYIIRADVLSPDGSKVIARAAVPFEREPGEAVAAVAPLEPAAPPAGQPVPAAPGAVAGTEPAAPGAPAVTPPADQPVSPGSTSPNPDVAAADGAHPGNPTPSAPQDQAAASPADAAPAPGAPPAKPADQAGVAPAPQPDQAAAAPAAPGQDQAAAAPASPNTVDGMPAEAAAPGDVATAPGTNAPADASTPPVAAAAPDASAPAPVDAAAPPVAGATAPKLQAVGSGVIIRRGDSLWRISKRVYGRGTRYSTIYVANRQQIRNPDLIWPGQIFRVPEKSDRGEDADMKAIGDQATTVQ